MIPWRGLDKGTRAEWLKAGWQEHYAGGRFRDRHFGPIRFYEYADSMMSSETLTIGKLTLIHWRDYNPRRKQYWEIKLEIKYDN